jgi:hypothetical protein
MAQNKSAKADFKFTNDWYIDRNMGWQTSIMREHISRLKRELPKLLDRGYRRGLANSLTRAG